MKNNKMVLFFAAAFFFVFFLSRTIADPDLWGHLQFGCDILKSHSIPSHDTYSYSAYGAPWINHEWLAELIFYIIYSFFGAGGLVLLKGLIGLIAVMLVISIMMRNAGSYFLRLFFIVAFLPSLAYGFAVRPQIFTYLFFALLIFSIDRFERSSRIGWMCWVPFMFMIWCNMHGGFVMGLGFLLLYMLVKIVEKKNVNSIIIIAGLSLFITLVNPYGIKLWVFIISAVAKTRPDIAEWQSITLSPCYAGYLMLTALAMAGIFFSKTKRDLFEFLAIAIGLVFSLRHNRHVPVFAILAASYAPKYLSSVAGGYFTALEKKFPEKFFSIVSILLAASIFLSMPDIKDMRPLRIEVPKDKYPSDAIAFLKDNNINGNIFPFFDWGEMCIRELSPYSKVFFDGRYETVYSDKIIEEYFGILNCRIDYRTVRGKFLETGIMLLHKLNPLAAALAIDKEWVRISTPGISVIYIKDNIANREILQRIQEGKLRYPDMKQAYYFK